MNASDTESWVNPTETRVLALRFPEIWVEPGASVAFPTTYHRAIHDAAPQLRCAAGDECDRKIPAKLLWG
jgi:hypothetical protein